METSFGAGAGTQLKTTTPGESWPLSRFFSVSFPGLFPGFDLVPPFTDQRPGFGVGVVRATRSKTGMRRTALTPRSAPMRSDRASVAGAPGRSAAVSAAASSLPTSSARSANDAPPDRAACTCASREALKRSSNCRACECASGLTRARSGPASASRACPTRASMVPARCPSRARTTRVVG